MLSWLTPYDSGVINSPLAHHFTWGTTRRHFTVWTTALILSTVSVLLLLYCFLNLPYWIKNYGSSIEIEVYGDALTTVFYLAIVLQFGVELWLIRRIWQSFTQAIETLKAANDPEAVDALTPANLYNYAQLRVWKLTMITVSARLTLVLLALLELREQFIKPEGAPFIAYQNGNVGVSDLLAWGLLAVVALAFVVEPIFRLKALSAWMMPILATRYTNSSITAGWLFRWALKIIIPLILIYISGGIVYGVVYQYAPQNARHVGGAVFIFCLLGATLWISYKIVRTLQAWSNTPQPLNLQDAIACTVSPLAPYTLSPVMNRLFPWRGLAARLQNTDNPVFRLEKRLLYTPTPESFRRWTRNLIIRSCLIILGFMAVALLLHFSGNPSPRTESDIYHFIYGFFSSIAALLAILSLMLSFFLDLNCISAGMNAINRDLTNGHWDLLRMSILPPQAVIEAKYRLTQFRAWRMLVLIVTMRIASVLFFIIPQFVPTPYATQNILERMFNTFAEQPVSMTIGILLVTIFVLTYLLEPFWRQQAMAAVGLNVSVGRTTTTNLILGFLAVIAVWISQGIIVGILITIMVQLSNITSQLFWLLNGQSGYNYMYQVSSTGVILLMCCVTAFTIFTYYSQLKRWMLNMTLSRTFSG